VLALEHVSKEYGPGRALEDVSVTVECGEMVTIWGERRSGRSMLLRIAAGIETPHRGVVRFDGHDLSSRDGARFGRDIGLCRTTFRGFGGPTVLDQIVSAQLARMVPAHLSRPKAHQALERVNGTGLGQVPVTNLKPHEAAKVAMARALTSSPRLLIFDEPTIGVDILKRDEILELLRSLADDGIGVLTSTGEGTGVLGADRVLSLSDGRLRGALAPELASVEVLARHRRARG
jgi:ABC-type multidrug transport system ATPase subunit